MNKGMNTRKYSSSQEKQVVKTIKGRRTSNSGATCFDKGDIKTDTFCVECKTAIGKKKSMTIQKAWIDKLKEEAFAMGKPNWAVCFDFGTDLQITEKFYIIDERLFKELMNMKEDL